MESEMRDLTPEELSLAPEWATHYIVDSDDSIIYESAFLCWWRGSIEPLNNEEAFGDIPNRAIKPLGIDKHEWSDITMQGYEAAKCANGSIILNGSSKSKVINKQDGIAIAKALGLTAEDLK